MDRENNFGRLLALLLIALGISFGMYYLPEEVFGWEIKKVDLLSDLREKAPEVSLDSLRNQLKEPDTLEVDSAALRNSIIRATEIDSAALALRDSLYNVMYSVRGADSLGKHIEDYSPGHVGLKRFFTALNNINNMNRPVRIAFMGDSFVEGDIVVADLRSSLQKMFGGRGVGFVPIMSVAAQYRPTIEQHSEGWHTWSILTDREEQGYTLSGMVFEPEKDKVATVSLKTSDRYPELKEVSSLKFIYEKSAATSMDLCCNGEADTLHAQLPPSEGITQYELKGGFTEASFSFTASEGLKALGVAMEDESGVVVDNYSLRGNSGLVLNHLDSVSCRQLNEIRPYDLIILQYGLNVANDSILQYGWYTKQMAEVVHHLRGCFPDADVLLLGVSDRSTQENGEFETMPAVLALLHAQRQIARKEGIPFWNTFGAMGGENSMVRFVENNWASKDYTHLSFRGGREIATALFEALLLEKKFYDEADKAIQ